MANSPHNPLRTHPRMVLMHHLIPTLYGHWPPNDLRVSGSTEFHDDKFNPLGPIHHGRRPHDEQPSRDELRAFHNEVKPLLNFPIFWIDGAKRLAIVEAIGAVIRRERYTCYRCGICSNHMHVVIRRHRDDWQTMWAHLVNAIVERLRPFPDIGPHHPVISQRPYCTYSYNVSEIEARIRYAGDNPQKEGLPEQHYDFETPYDGWPFARKRKNA